MYMTWQVMYMNGQQRRPTVPTVLVSLGEAITATTAAATFARAVATATLLLSAALTMVFVHFYL